VNAAACGAGHLQAVAFTGRAGRAHRESSNEEEGKQIPSADLIRGEQTLRLADSILMELEQEAQTTKRVLDRVPDNKLGWKPHAKSLSLGQLALHIASVPGSVASLAVPDTMEAPNFAWPDPKSRQEVLDTFSKSLESAKDTVKKMDDARLMTTWSLTRKGKVLMSVPRIGFIRSIMMNHLYHHRGQLSVYLRLLDVPVPSIYGPSADENPFV
jgi:uncharacterized damage-inducible protein DinB